MMRNLMKECKIQSVTIAHAGIKDNKTSVRNVLALIKVECNFTNLKA